MRFHTVASWYFNLTKTKSTFRYPVHRNERKYEDCCTNQIGDVRHLFVPFLHTQAQSATCPVTYQSSHLRQHSDRPNKHVTDVLLPLHRPNAAGKCGTESVFGQNYGKWPDEAVFIFHTESSRAFLRVSPKLIQIVWWNHQSREVKVQLMFENSADAKVWVERFFMAASSIGKVTQKFWLDTC